MQASMGLICRWKTPWVRLIVSFFAEGCLRRPWWGTLACSTSGGLVQCTRLSGAMGGRHSSQPSQRAYDIRCPS